MTPMFSPEVARGNSQSGRSHIDANLSFHRAERSLLACNRGPFLGKNISLRTNHTVGKRWYEQSRWVFEIFERFMLFQSKVDINFYF